MSNEQSADLPPSRRAIEQQLLRVETRLDRVEEALGFLKRMAVWTLRTLAAIGLIVVGQIVEAILG